MMFSNWECCRLQLSKQGIRGLDFNSWKSVIDILRVYNVKKVTLLGRCLNLVDLIKYCEKKKINPEVEVPIKNLSFLYGSMKNYIVCRMTVNDIKLLKEKSKTLGTPSTILLTFERKDLDSLIPALKTISKLDVNSIRLEITNSCSVRYSSFWQFRTSTKEIFSASDYKSLLAVTRIIKENKKEFKIANSDKYLNGIPTFGITQNWKCKYWDCPTIAPDGCLMACRDRYLISPISIFDLGDKYSEIRLREVFIATSIRCTGCYWESKVEEEYALKEGTV